ncbi:MAG: AAA family ATPase [Candidatus Babeliales bacterium]|nr:AAA family ATPase [Candidatus Babeliales bacterium]
MKILLRLTKMMLLIFAFQTGVANGKEQDNEYKLKEECEQLVVYFESYKTAYVSNPNNVFIKEVLLALIDKLQEKRSHPLTKQYIEARVDFDKLSKLKLELRIDKYKSTIVATAILGLIGTGVYKNRTTIYNYLCNNTDLILKSSLYAILPTTILSYALYQVISKSSKYFTDSIVSSNERMRLEQKSKQENPENNANMSEEKNSKAKLYRPHEIEEKFSSVAGVADAKEELEDIIDFLRKPEKYKAIGAKIPKGVLLVGEPGNGKTMLARAVAGEANCNFFSVNGSEFVEQWVGLGAARVRDLFTQARKNAPCIIFIDEIDAIGAKRSSNGESGGEREYSQTLNQLLVGMDGFEKSKTPIVVIGATNKPEVLDKALLRPGRFDRQVNVPNPDLISREQILKIHTNKIKTDLNIDFKILAAGTPGFSGAELANLVNESAIIAVKNKQVNVTMHNFDIARDKILLGKESTTVQLSLQERTVIGYHEAGHALVALLLPEICDPIFKVTISPRSKSLGVTYSLAETEAHLISKDDLIGQIKRSLGGRIAEELVFNKQFTGCGDDFEKATKVAKSMVYKYGMSNNVGTVNCNISKPDKVEDQVQQMLKEYYDETYKLLSANRDKLDKLANALIDKQTLFAAEIYKLLDIQPRKDFKIN